MLGTAADTPKAGCRPHCRPQRSRSALERPPGAARRAGASMGLACSKKCSQDEEGDGATPTIVRLSPFRPRRCSSLSRRPLCAGGAGGAGAVGDCAVPSLLLLAADAAAAGLAALPARSLAALPADLSQLLLERLISSAKLDDAAIARLDSLALHFFSLPLGGYPELVRPAWLRCLASPSLEEADLGKTGVSGRQAAGTAAACRPMRLPGRQAGGPWVVGERVPVA